MVGRAVVAVEDFSEMGSDWREVRFDDGTILHMSVQSWFIVNSVDDAPYTSNPCP